MALQFVLPGTRYKAMVKKIPIHPKHPERICWGCAHYCAADNMSCGNGSERTPHPVETFGDDWFEWQREEDTTPTPNQTA